MRVVQQRKRDNMKAICLNLGENDNPQIRNIEKPAISADQVLIKTLTTGICSTDRELLGSNFKAFPAHCDYLVLGHEATGFVAQKGHNVRDFELGDLVVATVRRRCSDTACPHCSRGRSDLCATGKFDERGISKLHGFMSEYFVEHPENIVNLSDAKSIGRLAALVEPLSIGVKGISQCFGLQQHRFETGEKGIFTRAVVLGAGAIGLLTATYLARKGIDFICLDIESPNGKKAALARKLGGQYFQISDDASDIEKVLARQGDSFAFDLLVDATANPQMLISILPQLSFNGMVLLLGLPSEAYAENREIGRAIWHSVFKNITMVGSVNSSRKHFVEAIECLKYFEAEKPGVMNSFITHSFDVDSYKEAFKAAPEDRIKVFIDW